MFTLVVGFLFFSSIFKPRQIIGVFIGLAGACLLIWLSSGDEKSLHPMFGFYVLVATVFYAFSVNILKHKVSHLSSIVVTGCALIFAGIPSGIYLFTTDFTEKLSHQPGAFHALIFVLILGLMGTAFSTIIFNKLVRMASALYASSVTYLIPFVAVLWGLYDGETFNFLYLLALMIIIAGIYLINYQKKKA
jgi:drug/metabolite transporter (DMT)-like permease